MQDKNYMYISTKSWTTCTEFLKFKNKSLKSLLTLPENKDEKQVSYKLQIGSDQLRALKKMTWYG